MVDKDDFEICISPGSSLAKIKKSLNAEGASKIEFLVTHNFVIYLHHTNWHQRLQDDSGIAPDDIMLLGNLSLDFENWEQRSAMVRFKSHGAPVPFVKGRRVPASVLQKREEKYIAQIRAAEAKICEFVRPLRTR